MSNSDLLKEAIADARAVKETAIANAKLALEEAFQPRIQSMISQRLEEEGEEEFGEEEEMPMDGEMDMEMEPGMEAGEDRDLNLGGQAYRVDNAGEALPSEEMPMDDEMGMEEEPVDEYDLSEILRQLDEEDDEMTPEYELNPGEDPDAHDLEEDVNIDELLKELMGGDEEEMDEYGMEHNDMDYNGDGKIDAKDTLLAKENEELKSELEEAYNAIKIMKSSLNEVNMLNAKLLFTNKLFKAHSLNESQKIKVIDTFDRARTIREVKLVYTTLSESFASKKTLVRESIASKPVASTRPAKQIILSEGDQIAARFKKLAGLGK
jgi:hypothetical protein